MLRSCCGAYLKTKNYIHTDKESDTTQVCRKEIIVMTSTKAKEIEEEYTSSLSDLTINSKPLINMLTMLADDNVEHASAIVHAVEKHLQKVTYPS